MTDKQDFHFPVVHNGMDYLVSVVNHLATTSEPRAAKYAVLHLQAATEVLLKWPLIQHDWCLVVEPNDNGDICDKATFERGDFRSIGLNAAIRLLKDELDIVVSSRSKRAISRLSNHRNRLQHLGMTGSTEAIEASAAKVLDFLLDFVHEHLRPTLNQSDAEHVIEQMTVVRASLANIQSLISARMTRIKTQLSNGVGPAVECSECGQYAAVVDAATLTVSCLFCHSSWKPEEAAEAYANGVLRLSWFTAVADGGEDPVLTCPECDLLTLVRGTRLSDTPDAQDDFCFNCGQQFTGMHSCEGGCGTLTDSDTGLCWDCESNARARF
ncbi:hypothetical protein ABZV80_43950 [Streptomyces sp. NPDC005132]|uniref:hypothetical protein n=1 Tax=Streptomyces sp. NPDC005132 TaxID=3154294 RepID=UPI0033AA75B7